MGNLEQSLSNINPVYNGALVVLTVCLGDVALQTQDGLI